MGQGAWKGDHNLLPKEQGIKILGCPIGHTDFVHHFLEGILEKQRELTNRIPQLEDVQKAWLLLYYCANSRANYYTRVVPPEYTGVYARGHDQCLRDCLYSILGINWESINLRWQKLSQLSFSRGGVGLRSATRLRFCAYWASWSDCLEMLQQRKPSLVDRILLELDRNGGDSVALQQLVRSATELTNLGVEIPSWQKLSEGARPPTQSVPDQTPGCFPVKGWQRWAAY